METLIYLVHQGPSLATWYIGNCKVGPPNKIGNWNIRVSGQHWVHGCILLNRNLEIESNQIFPPKNIYTPYTQLHTYFPKEWIEPTYLFANLFVFSSIETAVWMVEVFFLLASHFLFDKKATFGQYTVIPTPSLQKSSNTSKAVFRRLGYTLPKTNIAPKNDGFQ